MQYLTSNKIYQYHPKICIFLYYEIGNMQYLTSNKICQYHLKIYFFRLLQHLIRNQAIVILIEISKVWLFLKIMQTLLYVKYILLSTNI